MGNTCCWFQRPWAERFQDFEMKDKRVVIFTMTGQPLFSSDFNCLNDRLIVIHYIPPGLCTCLCASFSLLVWTYSLYFAQI